MTTTNLRLPRRPSSPWLPVLLSLSAFLAMALATHVVRYITTPRIAAHPTPALIIFATAQPQALIIATALPTAVPAPTATPDLALQQEVEQLRARVAQLEEQQPPVVYQVVNAAPVEAAPTPAPEQYQTMQQQAEPALTLQQAAILDRGAWAAQAQQQRGQP